MEESITSLYFLYLAYSLSFISSYITFISFFVIYSGNLNFLRSTQCRAQTYSKLLIIFILLKPRLQEVLLFLLLLSF